MAVFSSGFKFPILTSTGGVTYNQVLNSPNASPSTSGALLGWGSNSNGQLGNGGGSTSSPVITGTLTNWRTVVSGVKHSMFTKTDNSLWTCGYNSYGCLGINISTFTNYISPVQVGALTNWGNVACGNNYTLAIKTDGTLWAFGYNYYGVFGNNTVSTSYSSPIAIGALTNWSQVSSVNSFASFIKTDGSLWTCGYNVNGQLGNNTVISYSSPIQVGALTNWRQVSCGAYHSLAIKTDGTLWGWGSGANGDLGINNTVNYSSPIQVGALTNWKQVACGFYWSAAVKTDGTLWTWGLNGGGQLGNGTASYFSPVQVGALTNWSQVASSYYSMGAIKTDGTLWTCGQNEIGELGLGNTTYYSSPIQVGALTNWNYISAAAPVNSATSFMQAIAAYGTSTVGVLTSPIVDAADMFPYKDIFLNGGLFTCGNNLVGGIGNNTTTAYSSPVQVGTLTTWKQVSGGYLYMLAVKTDGTLWTWGNNSFGQLCNNTTTAYSSPILVGALNNWKQVGTCGISNAIMNAIKTDGTLWTCGYNKFGQLGINTTVSYSSPVQVGTLTNWKQVAAASGCTAAVKTDGTLWNWGNNTYGQLGNGTIVFYSSPIQVGALNNWKQVASGGSGTSAGFIVSIKTDGTLWSCGYNNAGVLGNNTTTAYSSPVQVGALTNWRQISCGVSHMAAVKTDGTLWGWGTTGSGELGIGTTASYSSPIQIGALSNWKQVSCGNGSTMAIKTDGTLWSCGYNNYGNLGNGTIVFYSSPIQIGTLTNWKQVSSVYWNLAAISAPELP